MTTTHESKRVVLGTAGHVDHGKTALVRALTGVDTDRLPEERARGISIELGFAEFSLPGGRTAAIVDVPGHERFVKNMLAGATGIDLVLLVVAADEGVMPQTREHLDIVRILGVPKGIKVITKADLVEPDWLEMVRADVEDLTAGTFLDDAPVVIVSAVSGQGLEDLRNTIDRMLDEVPNRDLFSYPRLPIDRVFSLPGHGTIVTGTLIAGRLRQDDRVSLLPSGREGRIRSLQVHGKKVETAFAGQRVAVNLAGIDRDEVLRGEVVTYPGWLSPVRTFAARVDLSPRAPHPLKNAAPVHVHYGTAETVGHVILLDSDELAPGKNGLVRIRTEEACVLTRGDRFIVRSYSPVTTLGGGTVIAAPSDHKRKSPQSISDLLQREKSDPALDILMLLARPPYIVSAAEMGKRLGTEAASLKETLSLLVASETVTERQQGYISRTTLQSLMDRISARLEEFLTRHQLRLSVSKEELRVMCIPEIDARGLNPLLALAIEAGLISVDGDRIRLTIPHGLTDERLSQARAKVVQRLTEGKFEPPAPEDMLRNLGLSAEEQADMIGNILESGEAIRISESLIMSKKAVDAALSCLMSLIASGQGVTVAQFRDAVGTSRRFALPLLEYFDQQKVTRRQGDVRVALTPPKR